MDVIEEIMALASLVGFIINLLVWLPILGHVL